VDAEVGACIGDDTVGVGHDLAGLIIEILSPPVRHARHAGSIKGIAETGRGYRSDGVAVVNPVQRYERHVAGRVSPYRFRLGVLNAQRPQGGDLRACLRESAGQYHHRG
jgi:hypothetical protein